MQVRLARKGLRDFGPELPGLLACVVDVDGGPVLTWSHDSTVGAPFYDLGGMLQSLDRFASSNPSILRRLRRRQADVRLTAIPLGDKGEPRRPVRVVGARGT